MCCIAAWAQPQAGFGLLGGTEKWPTHNNNTESITDREKLKLLPYTTEDWALLVPRKNMEKVEYKVPLQRTSTFLFIDAVPRKNLR